MLASHLRWLNATIPGAFFLFPARQAIVSQGERAFAPSIRPHSHMSSGSFRFLLRKALCECCHLSPQQAAQFGTHGMRIAGLEVLRRQGVSAEIRQQIGDWMSAPVALQYLQLPPSAQFDLLQSIYA